MTKVVQYWLEARRAARGAAEIDRGATMMEYALIVGAIALVVVIGARVFGEELAEIYDSFVDAI